MQKLKKKNILVLFFVVYPVIFWGQTWVQKDSLPALGRMGSFGFSIGGNGYIVNGYDSSSALKELWEYTPSTDSWVQKANFLGDARRGVGATVNGRAFVGIGSNGSNLKFDFYEYIPSINGWIQKANYPGNGARNIFMIGASNGRVYAGGGGKSNGDRSTQFYEYNPITDVWTLVSSNWVLGKRSGGVCFAKDSILYFGMGRNANTDFSDIWSYNTSTNLWAQLPSFPGVSRMHPQSMMIGDKVIVGGGHRLNNGVALSDYYVLDLISNSWSGPINHPSGNRTVAASFSIGDSAYLFGGRDSLGLYKNDLWLVNYITTSLNEKNTREHFHIYPVPAGNNINVKVPDSFLGETLRIIDINGKVQLEVGVKASLQNYNIESLPSGIYFVQTTNGEDQLIKKFIIK